VIFCTNFDCSTFQKLIATKWLEIDQGDLHL